MVNKFYSIKFTSPFGEQLKHAIRIVENNDGIFSAKVDKEQDIKFRLIKIEHCEKHDRLTIDFSGKITNIILSKKNTLNSKATADINGYHINFVINHGEVINSERKKNHPNQNEIISPFHSKVVEILVNKGDVVEKNQPMLRLESMKVISTFTAPSYCRIVEISVVEEQSVETGSILISFEPIAAVQ
jgi:biotin carboxyl carrier protein